VRARRLRAVAPGTFGSLVALVFYYLIRRQQSSAFELGAIAVIAVIGLWSATEAEHHFGGIDPGPVVIDEVVGMLMTLALHPVNIWGAIAGFFIFRVLDIVKPWPARRLELLPGGFGVVLDDMMAGVYGNLLVWGPGDAASFVVHMKPITRAAIIAVGSEMLTPTKIDTNSLFITEQLNLLGIQVAFKTIVGDDRGDLETAVRDALTRVDLLVCCGGLGRPTTTSRGLWSPTCCSVR
jgi:phosphatidylglycerophosphatase A